MAKRYSFHAEQWLPHPLDEVFAFFADPANLPRLMPSWQKARIEDAAFLVPPKPPVAFAGSEAVLAGTGTRLKLTFRPLPLSPVRLSWLARIEDFKWLHGFCDVQLRGPFDYWRHCHTVSPEMQEGVEGTRLRDSVEYTPPFGVLGAMANVLVLKRQMAAMFRFRHQQTLKLLAAS